MSDNETLVTNNTTETFNNITLSKRLILVNIKINLYEYHTDNIDYINKAIELTVDLLHRQKDNNYIEEVIGIDNELKMSFKEISEWLNNLRVLGSKNKRVQIFFELQINYLVVKLY